MSPPLVLLPGLMCDARVFAEQILELSRDTVVILAPITGESRVEALASGLLSRLPARFALAGIGLGGQVAIQIAARAPDRVERLCLIATSPLPETPAMAAAREPLIVAARSGRLDDVLRDCLKPERLAPGPGRPEVLGQFRTMGADLGVEVFVRQSRALQRRGDQQGSLAKCKVPALVLCGAHDTVLPVKRHEVMAALMPNATLKVLENSGALPPLEEPAAVTAILRDWLGAPLLLR